MIHPEQERVRKLLTEAVTLLCRNSLQFEEEVLVEGLIGITLDRSDILLISIRESVQQSLREVTSSIRSDKGLVSPGSPGKRKRRKRSQDSDGDAAPPATPPAKKPAPSVSDDDDSRPDPDQRLNVNVKKELPEDDQHHDNRNRTRNDTDGRAIHPAHDSSSSNLDNNQTSQNYGNSARVKQEPSGSDHSTSQPAADQQTLPPGGVRVKEEAEEEPDECFVIESDDEDMSNSSASNSMSLNMLENQLQLASQNWAVEDASGFDLSNLAHQGQNWSGQFDMSGQQMQGGNQGNMSFMGSPQPGTSQDGQRVNAVAVDALVTQGARASVTKMRGDAQGSYCPVCQRQYRHLKQHIQDCHSGKGEFVCPVCKCIFKQRRSRYRHVKEKHPEMLSDLRYALLHSD